MKEKKPKKINDEDWVMAITLPAQGYGQQITGSALDGFAITPSDSANLVAVARCLYIGTGGDVKVLTVQNTSLVFQNVQSGAIIPVQVGKVFATSTGATNIIGLI